MAKEPGVHLSRRERQIMDIVYRRGRAAAADVLADLPDAPSYSTVRTMLRVLEDKGHLRHEQDGPRYVFIPTVSRGSARRSAIRRLLQTFFDDSVEDAMAAMLDLSRSRISDEELRRIADLIEQARKEGR